MAPLYTLSESWHGQVKPGNDASENDDIHPQH